MIPTYDRDSALSGCSGCGHGAGHGSFGCRGHGYLIGVDDAGDPAFGSGHGSGYGYRGGYGYGDDTDPGNGDDDDTGNG